MRILFVTLGVFGGTKKGGGERYVSELARALARRGHDLDVAIIPSLTKFYQVNEIDSQPSRSTILRFAQQVRRADIVHIHQLNTPGFDYAMLLAKIFRKPVILTDHGGGALAFGRFLGDFRLRLIDAAAYVSSWSADDVDKSGIIRRSRIIFGGGDHLPDAPAMDRQYDFGLVGRLLPHKGIHVAIEALPSGSSLIIAGQQRDTTYYEELQRLSTGKDVTFLPNASDHIVSSLIKSIRFLLVPSVEEYKDKFYARPELLGLVALEAMASTTPVIGSNVGGLGEILNVAGEISLPPGDVEAWRRGLEAATKKQAPKPDRQRFTWDEVASKCERLYTEVGHPVYSQART